MKSALKFLSLLLLCSLARVSIVSADSIIGSKHDLSANPSIEGDLGACLFCHGAHGSEDVPAPLWNRSNSVSIFTLYSSTTMDDTAPSLGIMSLACMSCHDGVTAFDAFNGSPGTEGNNMNTIYPGSSAIIGDDLTDDHPVGVDITLDSAGIEDEPTITGAGLLLYDNKVECASCHDAHGSGGFGFFLRLDNANSALCMTCHKK